MERARGDRATARVRAGGAGRRGWRQLWLILHIAGLLATLVAAAALVWVAARIRIRAPPVAE